MVCVCLQAVEGTGLAFIVYSEAIKNMPVSQLWSVLYFIMLLLLGMGSMLGNVTAIITPLGDLKILSRTFSNETINGEIYSLRWFLYSSHLNQTSIQSGIKVKYCMFNTTLELKYTNNKCCTVYTVEVMLWCVAGVVCLVCLLLGLGFTTRSGSYWFTMFNDYGATLSLLFIVLFEVVSVCYIYGLKRWNWAL